MFWIFMIVVCGCSFVLVEQKMELNHKMREMMHDEEMARIKNGYIIADPSAYKDVTDVPKIIDNENSAPYRQYEN